MAGKQIAPVHPGTYLKELLEELELDVTEDQFGKRVTQEVQPCKAVA